jgi:hypothetical protein
MFDAIQTSHASTTAQSEFRRQDIFASLTVKTCERMLLAPVTAGPLIVAFEHPIGGYGARSSARLTRFRLQKRSR